jgi:hypothetical protein
MLAWRRSWADMRSSAQACRNCLMSALLANARRVYAEAPTLWKLEPEAEQRLWKELSPPPTKPQKSRLSPQVRPSCATVFWGRGQQLLVPIPVPGYLSSELVVFSNCRAMISSWI